MNVCKQVMGLAAQEGEEALDEVVKASGYLHAVSQQVRIAVEGSKERRDKVWGLREGERVKQGGERQSQPER